jgi:S-adenosylmethionine:tRNA ribosyltransferase-isomerase
VTGRSSVAAMPRPAPAGALSFTLPRALEAAAPPAVRDEVRLMVARPDRPLAHARFLDLPRFLSPGDLLVVNASATMPAALSARTSDGTAVELHLSTPEPPPAGRPDRWVVEVRHGGERFPGRAGEALALPAGGRAELLAPYLSPGRLWVARLVLPLPLEAYLAAHGKAIRYAHEPHDHPLSDHQTIFAAEPGSAEMPSAGRPFTRRAIAALRARGVSVAKLVLHTGVSSQERGERPYPERYRVPKATAAIANRARRVIAVGTTVVRALETVTDERGRVHPGEGWTSLVVTPERGVRAVDGLITGWHEPDASHLLMLEAIGCRQGSPRPGGGPGAGRELLERSYAAAVEHGYRWHEFGDSHLILPA